MTHYKDRERLLSHLLALAYVEGFKRHAELQLDDIHVTPGVVKEMALDNATKTMSDEDAAIKVMLTF